MYLKKAQLLRLPTGSLSLTPLEVVKNGNYFGYSNRDKICENLIEADKIHFGIYRENIGYDVIGNENHRATDVTEEDFAKIFANDGICFIEVDGDAYLRCPSNARGEIIVPIHFGCPEYVCSTKDMEEGFVFFATDETCPFCNKGKIVSGIYLHFQETGHPCCEACWSKKGFNEWFNDCQNLENKTQKQLDWFLDMFIRGYTPQQAIYDMNLAPV